MCANLAGIMRDYNECDNNMALHMCAKLAGTLQDSILGTRRAIQFSCKHCFAQHNNMIRPLPETHKPVLWDEYITPWRGSIEGS